MGKFAIIARLLMRNHLEPPEAIIGKLSEHLKMRWRQIPSRNWLGIEGARRASISNSSAAW